MFFLTLESRSAEPSAVPVGLSEVVMETLHFLKIKFNWEKNQDKREESLQTCTQVRDRPTDKRVHVTIQSLKRYQ